MQPIIGHTNGKILPAPNNPPATIAKPHRRNRRQLALAVRQAIARICAPRQYGPIEIRPSPGRILANALPEPIADMLYQWLIELRVLGRLCAASAGEWSPSLILGVELVRVRLYGTRIRVCRVPSLKHRKAYRVVMSNDQELSHAAGDFRQPETRSENSQV